MSHDFAITKPVGDGAQRLGGNQGNDVRKVQILLLEAIRLYRRLGGRLFYEHYIPVTGVAENRTLTGIRSYQQVVMKIPQPDGLVLPDGPVLTSLCLAARLRARIVGGSPDLSGLTPSSGERPGTSSVVPTSDTQKSGQLIWSHKLPSGIRDAFEKRIIGICGKVGIPDPDWLMACMAYETVYSMDPDKRCIDKNGNTVAIGLIQFTNRVMPLLGLKDKEELAGIGHLRQLEYVERYLMRYGNKKYRNEVDVYMAIFCPQAIDKPLEGTLYDKKNDGKKFKPYQANRHLDANHDQVISKAEAAAEITRVYKEGLRIRSKLK